MKINLNPEMNSKIADIMRLSKQPAQMYGAALIDAYRASGLEPDEIPSWIPVGEKLPKIEDEQYAVFLVPSLFNRESLQVKTARYFSETGWTSKEIVRAIYYMPLPLPPKGGK